MRSIRLLIARICRVHSSVADVALALVILATGALDIHVYPAIAGQPMPTHDQLRAFLLLGLSAGLLALRRKRLVFALVGVQVIAVVAGLTHTYHLVGVAGFLVELILLYTAAGRWPTSTSILGLVWLFALDLFTYWTLHIHLVAALYADFPVIFLFWFAGAVQWRRRRLAADLEERVTEVQHERERLAAQAIVAERGRIVGDLRSIVVHGIQQMTQEGHRASEHLARAPALAVRAIQEIEAAGRRTLVEMRRLLGILRDIQGAPFAASPNADSVVPTRAELVEERVVVVKSPASRRLREPIGGWIDRTADRIASLPVALDVAIVLVLGGLMALNFVDARGQWKPIEPLFGALVVGVLLFRRRLPISVLVASATVNLIWILYTGNGPVADVSLLVAVYTAAASREGRLGLGSAALGLIAYPPLLAHITRCPCFMYFLIQFVLMTMAGRAALASRKVVSELHAQTQLLQSTRAELVRTAVQQERLRVAREMHDVVAHGVTVMVMQAGLARMLAETEATRAQAGLDVVDRLGTEAISELRPLLAPADEIGGRTADDVRALPVRVGEDRSIRTLVKRESSAAQQVELREEGDAKHLDPGLEISLYRIVQEALTNARRHAPGARAVVSLRYSDESVEVEIVDTGAAILAAGGNEWGAGQGLIGIRERAAIFGGEAEMGPTLEGGFRVWARLPSGLVSA